MLTRGIDQTIHIDGDIVIWVLGVQKDKVKLGIEAPESKRILRGELVGDDRRRPAGSRMKEAHHARPRLENRTSGRSQDTPR